MHSIYHGIITHTRSSPKKHSFSYKTNMLYLDLDKINEAFSGKVFWSYNKPNFASFYRSDFYGDKNKTIKKSIQALLIKKINLNHKGKIFLLTTIRFLVIHSIQLAFITALMSQKKFKLLLPI